MVATALGGEAAFYIGTYTQPGKSKGIYLGHLDTETGKLGSMELASEAKNPNYLALSPDGKKLYASLNQSVAAFTVGARGQVTALDEKPSGGTGACHVSVDATGGNVFVANYSGGSIAAFRTNADGSLADRTALIQFEGSGPDHERQTKPYAHSIYADPANRFVYACDLGTDNIWIYRLDSATGGLSPATTKSGKVPPGGGPRHLAFNQSGKFAYVINEMGLSVTAFSCNGETGALTPLHTISSVPPGTESRKFTAAEIACHPNGRWLYASTRGPDLISVYSIADDGKLALIEHAPAHVKTPRGFGIDPTGRWLLAAGQDDDRIAVLKIDQATGQVAPNGETAEVGTPISVLFAP